MRCSDFNWLFTPPLPLLCGPAVQSSAPSTSAKVKYQHGSMRWKKWVCRVSLKSGPATKSSSTTHLFQLLKLRHAAEWEICVIDFSFVNHCYSSNKIQTLKIYLFVIYIYKKYIYLKTDNRVWFEKISEFILRPNRPGLAWGDVRSVLAGSR